MRAASLAVLALLFASPTLALLPGGGPEPDLLWLEADNIDGQRNLTLVAGNPVCSWHDTTAHDFKVVSGGQPGAGGVVARSPVTCPYYRTGVLNTSLTAPALEFNGTTDAFTAGHQLDCYLLNQPGCPAQQVKYTAFTVVRELVKTNVMLWGNLDQYAIDNTCQGGAGSYAGEGTSGNCVGATGTFNGCNFHVCSQGRGLGFALYPYPGTTSSLSLTASDDLTYGSNNISTSGTNPLVGDPSIVTFGANAGSAGFLTQTRVVAFVFDQSQPITSGPTVSPKLRVWVDGTEQVGFDPHPIGSGATRARAAPNGTFEIGRGFYAPEPARSNPDGTTTPYQASLPINNFQGMYAALLLYSGAMSATAQQTPAAYLANKYKSGIWLTPLPVPGTLTPTPTPTFRPTAVGGSCPNGPASQ